MAKKRRSRKQMAAFRKMRAGLRRWKAKHRRRRNPSRARRAPTGRKRRWKWTAARRAAFRKMTGARKGRSPRRRRHSAELVRTSRELPIPMSVLVASKSNPRRRKKNMAKRRRRRSRRSNPRHYRRRRSSGVHHRRRRRNPAGLGGAVKGLTRALIPAAIGGAAAGFLDAKVTGGLPTIARIGAKLAAAAVGGAVFRKNPVQAAAFTGAMLGTAAYEGGIRLGGGVIAVSRSQGIKELAAMAAEDEVSLGLLHEEMQGMGLLTEMGDDDDVRGMGEQEPDLGDEGEFGEAEPDLGDGYDD